MGTDEVMVKWVDKFYDSEMSQALKAGDQVAALARADYLARRVLVQGASLSSEDQDDAFQARSFTIEMTKTDDESRDMQTRFYRTEDAFKKEGNLD